MYEWGRGLPKDSVSAYAWYKLGASNGSEYARSQRQSLKPRMNLKQITADQELSEELSEQIEGRNEMTQ
ncbi:MAG: TPR repeat protein [Planctomycetota bacterium]|jgi:TPR repeat protein